MGSERQGAGANGLPEVQESLLERAEAERAKQTCKGESIMAEKRTPRRSIFDGLSEHSGKNLYCELENLSNEASVELFFVAPMLVDLKYKRSQIKTKKSISEFSVSLGGHRSVNYKPDFVMLYRGKPRWVLDAKGTDQRLDDWLAQCGGYCLRLNQDHADEDPVQYFVLTNGIETRLYQWNVRVPLIEMTFVDFAIGNPKYDQLKNLLNPSAFAADNSASVDDAATFKFERPTAQIAKQLFAQCHKVIWKSEGSSPTAAFIEFTKLMFVKLYCDRQLREDEKTKNLLEKSSFVKLPKNAVTFSTQWIDKETHATNPINDLLFCNLREKIELDIDERKKKRIFDKGEQIDLRPDTVRNVVARLQHWDMFGIDEDLNGRLFETFLSATMRGRELGQFFTPRSIVKLMTRMANLQVSRDHAKTDKVIDACCGTGGFLIEVLTEMRNAARANGSLTNKQRELLIDYICNECIYGIDFGKSPPIARIARINMYLHGDGGSRIYYADALDKEVKPMPGQDMEVTKNLRELQQAIADGLRFNAVLTNPPFSMTKELTNEQEGRVLKLYNLGKVAGTTRFRSSLRSNVMFMERYRDLLVPGGRLLTVIDDTLLASNDFSYVRDFIRENFIIRGIVSLPGDAFKRSGARVKTSVLYLERKHSPNETQPQVFVAFAENLGVDDLTYRASSEEISVARQAAEQEIAKIVTNFHRYLNGDPSVETVSAERVSERLDLKFVVPLQGRFVSRWRKSGIEVKRIGDVLSTVAELVKPFEHPNEEFTLLKVTYGGLCVPVKKHKGKHIKPETMQRVHTGDLIFSNIRATDGAVGVVPPELNNAVVSGSFTVLAGNTPADAVYLWSILRTYEIRADIMSDSTGTGRYTTEWSQVKEVQIPWLPEEKRKAIANGLVNAWEMQSKALRLHAKATEEIVALGVDSDDSKKRFEAYKPPQ